MSNPFIGQLAVFGFNFAPQGWAMCNGQLMPIQQNAALFSLLGTTYGGDGVQTFALPNLQGRLPMHFGSSEVQGEVNGSESVTLTPSQMGAHSHQVSCSSAAATLISPSGAVWAADNAGNLPYSSAGGSAMANTAIGNAGGSQSHDNIAPSLVVNICIALVGIFPARN